MPDCRLIKEKQIDIGRSGFVEPVYNANNQPTNIIEWKDAGKTQKLSEDIITYSNGLAVNVVSNTYFLNGSISQTLTSVPSYTGGIIDDITKTLS